MIQLSNISYVKRSFLATNVDQIAASEGDHEGIYLF
jgi:hypothetical protein